MPRREEISKLESDSTLWAVGQNLIGSFGRLQDTKPLQSSYEPLTASPLHILLLAHYIFGDLQERNEFLDLGALKEGHSGSSVSLNPPKVRSGFGN